MNWKQVTGLLLIILGSIALILAAEFSFAFTMSGVDGVPLFSFPYKGYVLPTLAIGVVLLILGVILTAVPLITEKRPHFPPPLPP